MARNTYRDLCISALRTSKAIGLDEDPGAGEIAYAIDRLNGLASQLFIDGVFAPYDLNVVGETYADGKAYFGINDPSFTHLSVDSLSGFTFSRLDRVIDASTQRELIFLRENDFILQEGDHSYYSHRWIAPSLIELQTSPGVKTISVSYKAMWMPVTLSTPFTLPHHYWDVLEYGLAVLMGEFFDVDVTNLSTIYQAYLKNIQAMNFEMPVMNAQRNRGNFYTGWM